MDLYTAIYDGIEEQVRNIVESTVFIVLYITTSRGSFSRQTQAEAEAIFSSFDEAVEYASTACKKQMGDDKEWKPRATGRKYRGVAKTTLLKYEGVNGRAVIEVDAGQFLNLSYQGDLKPRFFEYG